MAITTPRYRILPVRGTFAALVAEIDEINDNEICYAIDQDQYYQKEGNVLVQVGATKAQGALADTAVQPVDLGPVAFSNSYQDLDEKPNVVEVGDNISLLTNNVNYVTQLQGSSLYATAAQGAKADTAVQPAEIPVTSVNSQTGDVSLGIQDMNDYALYPASTGGAIWANDLNGGIVTCSTPNSWSPQPSGPNDWIGLSLTAEDNDLTSVFDALFPDIATGIGKVVTFYNANTTDLIATIVIETFTNEPPTGDSFCRIVFKTTNGSAEYDALQAYDGPITIAVDGVAVKAGPGSSVPIEVGQYLEYTADGTFKPKTPNTTAQPIDTATAPPSQGKNLGYTGNNKWEPVDSAESVNGQTGVVVLDLVDLDDVQYAVTAGTNNTTSTNKTGLTTVPNPQDWALSDGGPDDSSFIWNINSVNGTEFQSIPLNSAITFSTAGVADHVTTCSQAPQQNGGNVQSWFFRIADEWPAEWLALTSGSRTVSVTNVAISGSTLPPSDGQVITWVDSRSSWEPVSPNTTAQPIDTATTAPSAGKGLGYTGNNKWEPVDSVESVNGQTGALTLDVDSLNDTYTLDTGERFFNEGTHPTGAQTESGNYSIYDFALGNRGVYINRTDANANDIAPMFPDGFVFGNGGTAGFLRLSSTSGSGYTDYSFNYAFNSASSPTLGASTWVRFNMDNKAIPTTGQGDLYITTDLTTGNAPTDGQVLTWVDANSQWEPATPTGGGSTGDATIDGGNLETGIAAGDDSIIDGGLVT